MICLSVNVLSTASPPLFSRICFVKLSISCNILNDLDNSLLSIKSSRLLSNIESNKNIELEILLTASWTSSVYFNKSSPSVILPSVIILAETPIFWTNSCICSISEESIFPDNWFIEVSILKIGLSTTLSPGCIWFCILVWFSNVL